MATTFPVRKVLTVVVALLLLAVIVRAALPGVVKQRINAALDAIPGHTGRVEEVDLAVWRGALTAKRVTVESESGGDTPLFVSDTVYASIRWLALFRGALVGEIHFERPHVTLLDSDKPDQRQLGEGVDWREHLRRYLPIRINSLRITDGIVEFRNPQVRSDTAIMLTSLAMEARNLVNVADKPEDKFATFGLAAVVNDGRLKILGAADPLAERPTFNVDLTVEGLALPDLNDFLRAYASLDAESGVFSLYSEMVAEDGVLTGYAKPVIDRPKIFAIGEREPNFLAKAWEALAGVATEILKNNETEQIATRVDLSGEIDDPDASVWSAIAGVLRNAFVEAFTASLDESIGL